MKEKSKVIHVRLKSGQSIQPGNLDLDKNHLVVVPLFGEFFAIYSDVHYHGKVSNSLIRIIHRDHFVILGAEPDVEPINPGGE